jgi:hypothetical protein
MNKFKNAIEGTVAEQIKKKECINFKTVYLKIHIKKSKKKRNKESIRSKYMNHWYKKEG